MKKLQKSKHVSFFGTDNQNKIISKILKFLQPVLFKFKKWGWKLIAIEVIAYSSLIFILFTAFVNFYYPSKVANSKFDVYQLEKIEHHTFAIVFGAGLNADGTVSQMLADRVKIGFDLLISGKVDKLVLSGKNMNGVDEPKAMQKYALQKLNAGFARFYTSQIILDEKGNTTYDTCKNAYLNNVRNAILVTQQFHMSRALILCKLIGINSIGVDSDLSTYSDLFWLRLREIIALDKGIIDAKVLKPKN